MPTENFAIVNADGARYERFTVAKPLHLLPRVNDILVAVGWTSAGSLKATYRMEMPYGLPTIWPLPDPPPDPVDITSGVQLFRVDQYDETGGVTHRYFCAYDPYRHNPVSNPEITWVAMGFDYGDTVQNLASAIEGHGAFTVAKMYEWGTSGYGWIMELESTAGGIAGAPYSDGGQISATGDTMGFWVAVRYTGGAGYHVRDTYGSTTLHLYLTGLPLRFRFRVGDTGAEFDRFDMPYPSPHPASVTYEMVASRRQFALWNPDINAANILVSLPWLYPERGITTAAVVAAGIETRDLLIWQGSLAAAAVNGGFIAEPLPPHRISGIAGSYNPGPFAYAAGDDLVENALVMAPRADLPEEGSRVIGKLWNAFLMRKQATKGDITLRQGNRYMCVARGGGLGRPDASLWMRTGD